MPLAYLVTWTMVLLRTIGVVLQLPVISGRSIPAMVQVGICFCLATLLAGIVPMADVPTTFWPLLVSAGGEVIVGLALGFIVRMVFAAAEMAGRVITNEVGLNASAALGVPEPSTEPLTTLLSSLAVVLFFLFGGHLMMISALKRSFDLVLAGHPGLNPGAGETMMDATAHLIEIGFRIAAPFIAMNFLVTLAFSALGRVVPKMNPFILSYSVRLIAGFTLLGSSGALIARYFYTEFNDMPTRMLQLLVGH